ncbi:Hypothetical predicted protein [Octopus vulgaris]|uniref:NIF3-like protein 1 n=1 Tax=Octopus vulgaris TaxID=6645 RepID=A0AA36FJH6_OCTVU|nr:Hypothetical predicted protein [Octopus vulgaris]
MTFVLRIVVKSRFLLRINRLKIPHKITLNCQKNLCSQTLSSSEMSSTKKGNLSKIVALLNEFMPPSLAESWDNVGLLVEPTKPHHVSKILLTNDLTPEVLNEAIDLKANFILSYHPPIFTPLKRLCQSSWKQKLIVRAIENRIAIYSPHTSCDALKNGVNDWLLSAFENASTSPLSTKENPAFSFSHSVKVTVDVANHSSFLENLKKLSGVQILNDSAREDSFFVSFLCKKSSLQTIAQILKSHSIQDPVFTEIAKPPMPDTGIGRIAKLQTSITLTEAIEIIKKHLKLPHLRVATAHGPGFSFTDKTIKTVAVCAGSGSTVLRGVSADLYVSGEMSHHDVLDAIHNGSSVLLCEHSNTERGYLSQLKISLENLLSELTVEVCVSNIDADPLKIN